MLQYHYGNPYQHGQGLGNIFGGLIKRFIPAAKSFLKTSAGQVIKDVALNTASNLASDIIQGKNVKESAVSNLTNAKNEIGNYITKKINNPIEENSSNNNYKKSRPKKRKNIAYKTNQKRRKFNLLD